MPQDKDVSTQMSGSEAQQGMREREPPGVDSTAFHYRTHSNMVFGAWWRVNSLQNLEIKQESGSRVEWPSWKMNVVCCNEPCSEWNSHQDTAGDAMDMELSSLAKSLMHFFSGKDTLWCSRSHGKPTYLTVRQNSCPFFSIGCHRIPSRLVIRKTDARSKSYG